MMDTRGESTDFDRIADIYDEFVGTRANTADAVEFLASAAGKKRVLELGIGTGRVALPLAARGVRVSGIDASPLMVEKLRTKPGGASIPVTIGNFADLKVPGLFSLIYVVFSTFYGLLTQEEQIRCFARVARHLTDDGVFVIEGFVPDPGRFDRGQRTSILELSNDRVILDYSTHDPLHQRVHAMHVILTEAGTRFHPLRLRYAWPSEMDLMGRLAGLRLRERWGGWRRETFTAAGPVHISVYEKVPAVVELPTKRGTVSRPPARKRA
jgi:SAM-dependent methyltransferase